MIVEWISDCRFDDDAIVFDWIANEWSAAAAVETELLVGEHDGFVIGTIVEWADCEFVACESGGFESIAGVE